MSLSNWLQKTSGDVKRDVNERWWTTKGPVPSLFLLETGIVSWTCWWSTKYTTKHSRFLFNVWTLDVVSRWFPYLNQCNVSWWFSPARIKTPTTNGFDQKAADTQMLCCLEFSGTFSGAKVAADESIWSRCGRSLPGSRLLFIRCDEGANE